MEEAIRRRVTPSHITTHQTTNIACTKRPFLRPCYFLRVRAKILHATNRNKNIYTLRTAAPAVREEAEKIKKWREDQKTRLEQKDREEELKKEELREQARKELEDWYKQHEDSIGKTKSSNR